MMSNTATVDKRNGAPNSNAAATKAEVVKPVEAPIPDLIEERKKDVDGRVVVINRYLRGNLLGKVNNYFIYSSFLNVVLA